MRAILVGLFTLATGLGAQVNGDTTVQPQHLTLVATLSLGRSVGIRNTLANLGEQQAALRGSLMESVRLPSLGLALSGDRQTVNLDEFGLDLGPGGVTDPFSLFRARASTRLLLYDRATFERIRMARDSQAAAGADARRVGDLSAAAAGAAWLRLLSASETVRARENDSVTAVALRDIAAAQVDAGTAARIERTRSESQLAVVRSQLALARLAAQRARLDLARVLDLPATAELVTDGEAILPVGDLPTTGDEAVAVALANRSDLQAEQERSRLAEQAVTATRHEFWPTLAAQGYAQTSGTDLGRMSNSWNLGIGLSWNIFDGFARQRRLEMEELHRRAQQARTTELQHQVISDARQAVLDLASAQEQLTMAEERVRLAEQEMSEASERLSAGVTGTTETTRAQGQLAAARDNLIQARVMAGAAQVGAAAALGLLERIN